jgi:D-alanyl-D-alanine carboxypeptidase
VWRVFSACPARVRATNEYQDRLLQDAVARYGSEAEAARWVATEQTSAHVHGGAVDVVPGAVTEWLSANGAGYGLCRVYGNEPFQCRELSPGTPSAALGNDVSG